MESVAGRAAAAPVYFVGLDVLRLAAAVLVAFGHLYGFAPGVYGVEIFFVISGVVITQSATGRGAFDFLEGRVARLYPAAWICTAINVAAIAALGGAIPVTLIGPGALAPATIARSLALVGHGWVAGAYWTLPVEISFYALVAVLLAAGLFRFLLPLAAVAGAASTAFVVATLFADRGSPALAALLGKIGFQLPLLRYGMFFALGVLLLVAAERRWPRRACAGIALLVAAGALEVALRALEYPLPPAERRAMAAAGEAIWLAATAMILVSLACARAIRPAPRLRATIRTGGLITYPFYLLHQAVGGVVLTFALGAGVGRPLGGALGIAGAALVAWGVVRLGEVPLRRLLRAAIERHVRPPLAAWPPLRPLFQPR